MEIVQKNKTSYNNLKSRDNKNGKSNMNKKSHSTTVRRLVPYFPCCCLVSQCKLWEEQIISKSVRDRG